MNATRKKVESTARKARYYDYIMVMPKGFDTVIGEYIAILSGSEQQHISICSELLHH